MLGARSGTRRHLKFGYDSRQIIDFFSIICYYNYRDGRWVSQRSNMIIHNISFDSVEWLSKNNKLIRVWRSDADYEPEGLEERWMSFTYPD